MASRAAAVARRLADGQQLEYSDQTSSWTPRTPGSAILTERKFTMMIAMNSSGTCPAGFTSESIDTLRGANHWLYLVLNGDGSYVGGSDSLSYGGQYLKVGFVGGTGGNGPTTLCTREYRSEGRPHVSMINYAASFATCPSGWFAVAGNSNFYAERTRYGLYLGGLADWGKAANVDGWVSTNITGQDDTACYKLENVANFP